MVVYQTSSTKDQKLLNHMIYGPEQAYAHFHHFCQVSHVLPMYRQGRIGFNLTELSWSVSWMVGNVLMLRPVTETPFSLFSWSRERVTLTHGPWSQPCFRKLHLHWVNIQRSCRRWPWECKPTGRKIFRQYLGKQKSKQHSSTSQAIISIE